MPRVEVGDFGDHFRRVADAPIIAVESAVDGGVVGLGELCDDAHAEPGPVVSAHVEQVEARRVVEGGREPPFGDHRLAVRAPIDDAGDVRETGARI